MTDVASGEDVAPGQLVEEYVSWVESHAKPAFAKAKQAIRGTGVRAEDISRSGELPMIGIRVYHRGRKPFTYLLLLDPKDDGPGRGVVNKRRHVPEPAFRPKNPNAPGARSDLGEGAIKYDEEVRFFDQEPDESASHFSKITEDDIVSDVLEAFRGYRGAPRF